MSASFFFYDLETSGFSARSARIMQFAGQRTDLDLKPIGEPVNHLIKLSPDVLPDPGAILVTGITPQQTLIEGLTEAEFLKIFSDEVVQPDTIFIGFNSIRFDDEFMRFLLYRNFYDAYEWQWQNGCSRWDLLDVVRMTRALRPDGIEWPFAPDGKPANRLEFLTRVNKLSHDNAHDALSDVNATIALARLIKEKQPELFDYLLKHRDKKSVAELIGGGQPFVYTTGRYSSEYLHTSVAVLLARHDKQDAALVYDLRFDPTPFVNMSVAEIKKAWAFTKDPDALRLPVKTVKYNRCPAAAPLGVIKDETTQERLQLSLETVQQNLKLLQKHHQELAAKVAQAVSELDADRERSQTSLVDNPLTVDERLYDGFIDGGDKTIMRAIRAAAPKSLTDFVDQLSDQRLKSMLPLYKARNFPSALNAEERESWEAFCRQKLFDGDAASPAALYFQRLQELASSQLSDAQRYLLEELQLYGESILPTE
ncbi:MAG TPA: exodeoxyribonuclease I [Candidatus Saccharimonadales bacterium]|nr:exodeoxyribonuclease I [Candidatus Saccharimonadales bacterium]